MCNGCGMVCCAWDGFSGCGCDCRNPACWEPCEECHAPLAPGEPCAACGPEDADAEETKEEVMYAE